jgi:predicted MFS family arabinose efflux permease
MRLRGNLLPLIAGGTFLLAFDQTSFAIAVPDIQQTLDCSVVQLTWAQNAYSGALAVGLPLLAAGAGFAGRILAYRAGLVLFFLGAATSTLAVNGGMLIAARTLQGFGAAALVGLGIALLAATLDGVRLSRAVGIVSAASAIGLATGPAAAGIAIDVVGWRGLLGAEAAMALGLLAIGLMTLNDKRETRERALDPLGAVLASTGIGALVLGIHALHPDGASGAALACAALVIVAVLAFIWRERSANRPILPLGLIRQSPYRVALITGLLSYAGVSALFFYISITVQQHLQWSATAAGLLILPITVGIVSGSLRATAMVQRRGTRATVALGYALCSLGIILTLPIGFGDLGTLALVLGGFVSGIGIGLASPIALTFGLEAAAPNESAIASSWIWIARQVGTSAGFAVMALIVSAFRVPITGVRVMFAVSALVVGACVVVGLTIPSQDGRARANRKRGMGSVS